MALVVKDITFGYPGADRLILQNISLTLRGGERVGLIAPSGYGKTTLCKLLAGYETPDSGGVWLDDRPLSGIRGYCPVQMIWQHPELVINPRLPLNKTLAEAADINPQILTELGIENDWLSRYPAELSGGELQRFCIARALGEKTRYLLADEITTMLDLITQSQIWNFLIKETQRRGIGLLAVSHSPALLERICTRMIVLS